MKIFLDTANLKEIKSIKDFINIHGITTNPSLIAKEKVDYIERTVEIMKIFQSSCKFESISIELISTTYNNMIKELTNILNKIKESFNDEFQYSMVKHYITVKLPLTEDGLKMCKYIRTNYGEIKVNMTLIFSVNQALLAMNCGADYISPFIGRIDDIGYNGLDLVRELCEIKEENNILNIKIIAASIRSAYHINKCAKYGCDIFTIPPKVLYQMIKHPLTDAGLNKFVNDYMKSVKNNNLNNITFID